VLVVIWPIFGRITAMGSLETALPASAGDTGLSALSAASATFRVGLPFSCC
jgi:hypothetical protein